MKLALIGLLMGCAMNAYAQTETFESTPLGALPSGWSAGSTGGGSPHWAVSGDSTAPSSPNVLLQSGRGPFPWAVKNGAIVINGHVEVKFKPIAGREDQAGGIIWRWKDGNNYYVARANALENNVSLYYTMNGKRNTIKYMNAPVSANTWHTLRVDYKDAQIRVSLDGKVYIEERDTHLTGAGAVGLWTKSDSVTAFDDFKYGGDEGAK